MCRFLLARIGKPIAVSAGEQAANAVQFGDAATAIQHSSLHIADMQSEPAMRIDGSDKVVSSLIRASHATSGLGRACSVAPDCRSRLSGAPLSLSGEMKPRGSTLTAAVNESHWLVAVAAPIS
jgi:hypothetical protein